MYSINAIYHYFWKITFDMIIQDVENITTLKNHALIKRGWNIVEYSY